MARHGVKNQCTRVYESIDTSWPLGCGEAGVVCIFFADRCRLRMRGPQALPAPLRPENRSSRAVTLWFSGLAGKECFEFLGIARQTVEFRDHVFIGVEDDVIRNGGGLKSRLLHFAVGLRRLVTAIGI